MEFLKVFNIEVDNIENLQQRFAYSFSNEKLIAKTIKIAEECGVKLLAATVQACIDAVYSASNPTTDFEHEYERTLALLDAHIVENAGLDQIVLIDPAAEAVDPHSGRELVSDYAIPVHEGYTQYVFGRNTGVFVPGKFWMETTVAEQSPILLQFIQAAFEEIIIEVLEEVFQ